MNVYTICTAKIVSVRVSENPAFIRPNYVARALILTNRKCDGSTGLGIGEGVMMLFEIKSASHGDIVKPVTWNCLAEMAARCPQRIKKRVIRIIHLIYTERGFQTPFVKTGIVRYKRKSLYFRSNCLPYF